MLLAQDTELMILDEPSNFLDVEHQLEVLELLLDLNKNEGKTILMVLHDLNHAIKYSHKIFLMKNGEIIEEGRPLEIIKSNKLSEVFNVDFELTKEKRTNKEHLILYKMRK